MPVRCLFTRNLGAQDLLLGLLYWGNCVYLLCSRMRGERGTGAETPGMPGRSPDRLKALPETRKGSTSQCSLKFAVQLKIRGLGAGLGPSWGALERLGALLRLTWDALGGLGGVPGGSWGCPGGGLGGVLWGSWGLLAGC